MKTINLNDYIEADVKQPGDGIAMLFEQLHIVSSGDESVLLCDEGKFIAMLFPRSMIEVRVKERDDV